MTTINTNGEFVDLETLLGVTFESGNIYTFQAENLCYLKQGDFEEATINFILPFTYKADGTGIQIKTPIGMTCDFKLISVTEA